MKSIIKEFKSKKGFTLIELLVTISILAILVLLALPRFLGHTDKAREIHILNDVKATEVKVLEHLAEKSVFNEISDGIVNLESLDSNRFRSINDISPTNDLYKLSEEFLSESLNTNLGGEFYANNDGKVFYYDENLLAIDNDASDRDPVDASDRDPVDKKGEYPGPEPTKTDGVNLADQSKLTYRFHGEVSADKLITGNELAEKIGLTAGIENTDKNTGESFSNEPWLKFTKHEEGTGKLKSTIYVAKKPFRHSISWSAINAVGAVFGDKIPSNALRIKDESYKVRLLGGAKEDAAWGERLYAEGSEWDYTMIPIHQIAVEYGVEPTEHKLGNGINNRYTDEELLTNSYYGSGALSWTSTYAPDSRENVLRGSNSSSVPSSTLYTAQRSGSTNTRGWRPVLELIVE